MTQRIEIVLVDDEQLQLDYMQKLVTQAADSLSIDVEIHQYLSGEAFCLRWKTILPGILPF